MPVTVKTADHEAALIRSWKLERCSSHPLGILNGLPSQKHGELLQSSFDGADFPPSMLADRNGFVHSVTTAYNDHHHLVIRPDDIWLAITTQFSSYVNAHAEELRHAFVAHEGQKDLIVEYASGDRYTINWANFAEEIVGLIEQNILDPNLREWIVPAFTTTTLHDQITAQVVMMGTLKAYFTYGATIACGIPTVTLEGSQRDYELILKRLDKLCEYGDETTNFSNMLKSVVQGFIDTFENPESDSVKSFWKQICDWKGGSGMSYYSGWITAFCFWDTKGKRQVKELGDKVSAEKIPNGFTTVPVTIDDGGEKSHAEMLAGSIGMVCTVSGKPSDKDSVYGISGLREQEEMDREEDGPVGHDSVQAQLGWFMYEKAD